MLQVNSVNGLTEPVSRECKQRFDEWVGESLRVGEQLVRVQLGWESWMCVCDERIPEYVYVEVSKVCSDA